MKNVFHSLLALAIICASGQVWAANADAYSYRRILRSKPQQLDPILTEDSDDIKVIRQLFDQLVAFDKDLHLRPRLAEDWRVSKGGLRYTFTIRRDVRFSSGGPLGLDDIIYSLKRVIKEPMSRFYRDFYVIRGAQGFREGRSRDVPGILKVGERTLQIELTKPSPYFLSILASQAGSVVKADLGKTAKSGPLTGSGPFVLECVKDDVVSLRANADYFLGAPQISRIVHRIYPQKEDAIRDFLDGKLDDIAPYLLPDDVDKTRFQRVFANGIISFSAVFNSSVPPLDDSRVRRALTMAVDFDRILKDLSLKYPQLRRSRSAIPKGRIGFDPEYAGLPSNPREARRLLKIAGYPDPAALPPITLFHTGAIPYSDETADGIKRDLNKLGIRFEVKKVPYAEVGRTLSSGKWQMHLAGFDTQYPDSYFLMRSFHSKSQASWVRLNDQGIDRLIERCGTESIPEKRLDMFQQLNRSIVGDAYLIPLFSGDMFDGYFQPWIEGIQYPPSGFFQLELFPISINPKLAGHRKAAEDERPCGNE